jgi:hypothetical protein
MTATHYRDPWYFVLATVFTCAFLGLGFYANGLISSLSLVAGGMWLGHLLTELLNDGRTETLAEEA